MRIKIYLIYVLLVASSTPSLAQLKISQFGGIGMGIEPRTDFKLIIKGGLILTTYPEIPSPLSRFTEFKIKLGNGWPGVEFGTPTQRIAVWSTEVGYNFLYAGRYFTQSDSATKTEIEPISNALETILQLNGYSYKLKYDSLVEQNKTLGFMAQQVQEFLPELVDTAKGIMLIDYQQITPLLVEAVKEQQIIIDNLRNVSSQERRANPEIAKNEFLDSLIQEMNKIRNQLTICCNLNQSTSTNSIVKAEVSSTLYQNRPNPFSEKTVIEFEIKDVFHSASIMIFDMQGTLKKIVSISSNGKGSIEINGFELTAGMYLYSLIVDDKEIDTKRLILVN